MNFNDNKPIYLQITDKIMDSIITGKYSSDERLPSVRDYASDVEVNPNTVMRAYEWLQRNELIYNKRGLGYFLDSGAKKKIIKMRRDIFFKEEADYFFRRIASFGITPEELDELYREHLAGKNDPE